jgi:hypothetical protein
MIFGVFLLLFVDIQRQQTCILASFMLQLFETTDPPPPGHSGGLTKFSGDLTLFNNCYAPEGGRGKTRKRNGPAEPEGRNRKSGNGIEGKTRKRG